jgi:ankyrin repeat protein
MYSDTIFNNAIFNILGKNHTSGMICYVIHKDPCVVSWKNDNFDGDLPLHYAIKKKCSLRTIQVLLKAYPNAVKVKNNKGKKKEKPIYKDPLGVNTDAMFGIQFFAELKQIKRQLYFASKLLLSGSSSNNNYFCTNTFLCLYFTIKLLSSQVGRMASERLW